MASSPRLNTISRNASARGPRGSDPEDYSRMPIGDDRPGRRAQACVFAFPLLLLVGLAFPVWAAVDLTALEAAVVWIQADANSKPGAGCVIKVEGERAYILTAYHVIKPAWEGNPRRYEVDVRFRGQVGQPARGKITEDWLSAQADIAVLVVDQPPATLVIPVGSAERLRKQDEVTAIGHPSGSSWAVTRGSVSNLEPQYIVFSGDAVDAGNSGGPLLDATGQIVGLVVQERGKQGLALNADFVKLFVRLWVGELPSSGQAGARPAPPAAQTTPPTPPSPAAPPARLSGVLKVAILAPLSGRYAPLGIPTRDGALLAIEEWNAKGGILGRRITPVIEDSQCMPEPAIRAASNVIDRDQVKFVIGEVCSPASIAVSEIANSKKVVQISPISTNRNVTLGGDGKAKQFIFRACFEDTFEGKVGAKFALDSLRAKTAYIVLDQGSDYMKGLAESFEKLFVGRGGEVVGKGMYTAKDTDFSAFLASVAATKADVVYLPSSLYVANLVTKQAKEKGIKAPFIGGSAWDLPQLDLKAADGSYYIVHYSALDTRPEVRTLVRAFGAMYKDDRGQPKVPDALAALAYDATNLLLTAIREANAEDTEKVAAVLAKSSFNAVSGKLTFDANHNPVKPGTVLAVKNGRVVFTGVVAP